MAATVGISESNGATPTVTDSVPRTDWLNADSVGNSDKRATNPITKPAPAGTSRSFEKWHRLHWVSGTATTLDVIRHYISAGTIDTGYSLFTSASTGTPSNRTFATPVATDSTHAVNAMPTVDPAAANISGSLSASGQRSGYVVTQLDLADTVVIGQTQLTITFKYNETA